MKSICFANVKGGVGKSSLTIVSANYLSQKSNVVIVDCDLLQKTCYTAWIMSENPNYDVITFDPGSDEKAWASLAKDIDNYDYVFFDIPGTIFQEGVITLLNMMDKLVLITKCSPKDLSSTQKFIEEVIADNKSNSFDYKVLLNMMWPYRDQEHKDALKCIEDEKSGVVNEILGVEITKFFKNNIMMEQAAIEKNMEIGVMHNKIESKYTPFFEELVEFINE